MPDGRKHSHARVAAVVTASLTTLGLGIVTATPASAAPKNINAAQARVDRLSEQAHAAQQRHHKARVSLKASRTQLKVLNKSIRRHQHTLDSLRAQVADAVTSTHDDVGGSSAPQTPLPKDLAQDSEILLTNITLVSEDIGARADAMTDTNAQLEVLEQRRTAVRVQVLAKRSAEKTLHERERQVASRTSRAGSRLALLQDQVERAEKLAAAKRLAEQGGPVLAYAKSKLGDAYVYGAAGPSAFDCSGLTMMAWSQAGVSLPHSSSAQYNSGPHVSESELQPGDLVFYYSPISHVGIYIGNGQIVNALNPGAGVKISGLHDMPYSGAVRPG